jgi:hypothetical protein
MIILLQNTERTLMAELDKLKGAGAGQAVIQNIIELRIASRRKKLLLYDDSATALAQFHQITAPRLRNRKPPFVDTIPALEAAIRTAKGLPALNRDGSGEFKRKSSPKYVQKRFSMPGQTNFEKRVTGFGGRPI